MKNKMMILAGAALLLACSSVRADDSANTAGMSYDSAKELFRANEFSVDAFGTASQGKYTVDHLSGSRIRHNTRLGAGVGGNYFFTKMIGIGGMVYSQDTSGALVDNASVDLLIRFPIGCFAPYALGGGGRQFERARNWYAEFGAGFEVRFTPHLGLFTDVRAVVPEHTKLYALERLGFRFSF